MKYVIAIDVGIQNLGLCVCNVSTTPPTICVWKRCTLCASDSFYSRDLVEHIHAFIASYDAYFHDAERILIEQQMRVNMRVVEAVIHALFFKETLVIHARTIKAHFQLSTKNYKNNKAAAVQFVTQLLDASIPQSSYFLHYDAAALHVWNSEVKKDDLADALLMILYFLATYKGTWGDIMHKTT